MPLFDHAHPRSPILSNLHFGKASTRLRSSSNQLKLIVQDLISESKPSRELHGTGSEGTSALDTNGIRTSSFNEKLAQPQSPIMAMSAYVQPRVQAVKPQHEDLINLLRLEVKGAEERQMPQTLRENILKDITSSSSENEKGFQAQPPFSNSPPDNPIPIKRTKANEAVPSSIRSSLVTNSRNSSNDRIHNKFKWSRLQNPDADRQRFQSYPLLPRVKDLSNAVDDADDKSHRRAFTFMSSKLTGRKQ